MKVLIIYLLSMMFTTIMYTKLFAMRHIDYRSYRDSSATWGTLMVALILGVVPVINTILALAGTVLFCCLIMDSQKFKDKSGWINTPIFKSKKE